MNIGRFSGFRLQLDCDAELSFWERAYARKRAIALLVFREFGELR